ncbi:urea ABC transporter ATP-binding subunit UrtE [Actinokineospora sp. PR83]|uniref:urea ABC transporter ATP-binding subunit UrtE n=1 Tax=Actinokineospora sp. PR83 TaxID=2884908 RepID=UPI001F172C72|nr:urea ABC transporter ATP-binding subunit UrtE [Actinokineospora sp. PR83]MCG8917412.1 urea ABC transporter ATP-binding subunit UrtE [Actinokineospora sp. PR83]
MLEMIDVHVGYGRTTVVHGATVAVPAEAVVAVTGHNGAGKTTLLRAAAGLLRPTSGKILLDGVDVTRMRPNERVKRGLAYVPQGQQCFPQLTAEDNLRLVADTRRDGKRLIREALDMFPALVPMLGRRAGLLSGGQRQQLAIARALITQPRLLILDEPTEGIQPSVVAEIEETIRTLATGGGLSVLLVEQHIGFALSAADRYYVLEAGRVTATGDGGPGAVEHVRTAMAI